MANRWGNNGNKVTGFIFLGSKITADGDCSHEIKRRLPVYLAYLSHSFLNSGFRDSSVGKESTCNAGDPNSVPRLGRSARKGIGYALQYSWTSLVAQLVKNLPAMWKTWVNPWVGKIPWRRGRLSTPVFLPGECHGLYSPQGHKELDRTESLLLSLSFIA